MHMDHSTELLWIFGWRWLLLLQLFMAGRSALLSKADIVKDVAVCWAQWPSCSSTQHTGAL